MNPSDFEIRSLLNGGDADLNSGLEVVDTRFRVGVCFHLRRRFPGLSLEDVGDVWSETLIAIWKSAKAGTIEQQGSMPLDSLVWRIAYRRASDRLRRNKSRDQLISEIADYLRETGVGRKWSRLDPVERQELMDIILDEIALLPSKQKTVLEVFVANFPVTINELRIIVSEATGRSETVKSVARALEEGRKAVRKALHRKSFTIGVHTR